MLFRENKIILIFYPRISILTELLRKTGRHTKISQLSNMPKSPNAQVAQGLFYVITINLLSLAQDAGRLRVKGNGFAVYCIFTEWYTENQTYRKPSSCTADKSCE